MSKDTSSPSGPKRRVGRPAKLTVEQIVDAAIALIDDQGASSLSVRAVAHRLGVTPMALYNHVANRDDLESLIAAKISAERRAKWNADGDDWRTAIRRSAHFYQEIYQDHPELAQLRSLLDRADWNFVGVERLLAGLTSDGLPEKDAIRIAHIAHLIYRGYITTLKADSSAQTSAQSLIALAIDENQSAAFPGIARASDTAPTMNLSLTAAIDFFADLVALLVERKAH